MLICFCHSFFWFRVFLRVLSSGLLQSLCNLQHPVPSRPPNPANNARPTIQWHCAVSATHGAVWAAHSYLVLQIANLDIWTSVNESLPELFFENLWKSIKSHSNPCMFQLSAKFQKTKNYPWTSKHLLNTGPPGGLRLDVFGVCAKTRICILTYGEWPKWWLHRNFMSLCKASEELGFLPTHSNHI